MLPEQVFGRLTRGRSQEQSAESSGRRRGALSGESFEPQSSAPPARTGAFLDSRRLPASIWPMVRVIATGGCGYIGSHTLVELLLSGFDPVSDFF